MTDPTAPVTPRTVLHAYLETADPIVAETAIALLDVELAEVREAGSTNALRAALIGLDDAFQWIRKEYPAALVAMPTEFYRGFEQARAALAASDAGPAGIDVERLREAFIETGHAIQRVAGNIDERPSFPEVADVYARLSRESDR
jgi:hypothetical protein